jgi:protein O-GlcNAc transferase
VTERILEQTTDEAPSPQTLFAQAIELQNTGQKEKAADLYRRILETNPDFADAHNNLGNALFSLGKVADAAAS